MRTWWVVIETAETVCFAVFCLSKVLNHAVLHFVNILVLLFHYKIEI